MLGMLRFPVFALVTGVTTALAQQPGEIRGQIRDKDGTAVAGITVTLDSSLAVRSDGEGRFRFRLVEPGAHALTARGLGYQDLRQYVTVPAGLVAEVNLTLAGAALDVGAVTVIGTREELAEVREALRRVPGAVQLIDPEQIRATRQANFQDVLRLTPGVWVQPRFGAADESQLSIRGSGLRNNFHLRGVNLLVNGMAYRNADGFTDFESLELLTAEAIEVHKGGNALRYGGSTLGGAINLQTKTGYTAQPLAAFAQGGAYGFFKGQVSSGMARNGFDYYASYARTSLDGFRDWSDNTRDRVNAHLGFAFSQALDARAFYFFARVREHLPGSLTQAEFDSAPRMAVPGNVTNRWGRDYDLHHAGLQFRGQLSPTQRLEVSPYLQYRVIDHPIFRVIAQVSRDFGAELRYTNTATVAGRENRLTVGFQPAHENMDNRQYANAGGAHGALQKDQKETVRSAAVYLENMHALTPRGGTSVVVGVRLDHSSRQAEDFFLSDGDQSDTRVFDAVSPKIGALVRLPSVDGEVFANVSRSVEPPLLLELNSLTVPGFIPLDAQSAWQLEIGTRGRSGRLRWDVAAYDIELRDEILNINVEPFPGAGFTVPTYRNTPRTRHAGLEAGIEYGGDRLSTRIAYTLGAFTYVRDSSFSGNQIPGAPRHAVQGEVRWRDGRGLSVTPSVEWVPQAYFVNSANTQRNQGWATLGIRAEWLVPGTSAAVFAGGQNLTNHRYSGSVQVENAAGRAFEPADGRTFYAGFRWQR